ncbi:MAG: hypothetical protein E7311_02075 [Clostridiales bacterium]|nr:hypothetical protein [Clostridiales bacterium]
MFINIKINLKTIIIICIIIALIITGFSIYSVFGVSKNITNPDLIELNTDNYTNVLKEIHMYPDRYKNHPIKGNGFIFIDNTLDKNQFVLARNMIVCCENDPVVVGILCEYSGIDKFEVSSWVEIEGTIDIIERNGFTIPIIKIISINNSKCPVNPNVVPPTI